MPEEHEPEEPEPEEAEEDEPIFFSNAYFSDPERLMRLLQDAELFPKEDRELREKFPEIFRKVDAIKANPNRPKPVFALTDTKLRSAHKHECAWCGNNFVPQRPEQQFCGVPHAYEYQKAKGKRQSNASRIARIVRAQQKTEEKAERFRQLRDSHDIEILHYGDWWKWRCRTCDIFGMKSRTKEAAERRAQAHIRRMTADSE